MLLEVSDPSQIAAARRAATSLAETRGLGDEAIGRVALVATEMATNLLKHGHGGRISLDVYGDASGTGVELIAFDAGSGIANVPLALTDGFSTAGTMGVGLGVIQRQANLFTLFSQPAMGTVLVARVAGTAAASEIGVILGAVSVPHPDEMVCGDGWAYAAAGVGPTLLLVDGSGHGSDAQLASAMAIKVFQENAQVSCTRLMEIIHQALAPTRGAAVGVARIDLQAQLVRFVGVGNISSAMLSGGNVKRMVSHHGTAGMMAPRIREFTYPYESPPTVILHSDGLTTNWDFAKYPGLLVAHPSVIAGLMFRDFRRGRDDATVAVMRSVS